MGRRVRTAFQRLPLHGQTIILLLNAKGKQQTWLAEQCGVTPSMINHLIAGRTTPSLPVALKISKALGGTVETIFKDLV